MNDNRPKSKIVNRWGIKLEQANKAVDSTATRVTPPASSLRSGQESRHGQP